MSGLKDRLQRMKKGDAAPRSSIIDESSVKLGADWERIEAECVTNEWGTFVRRVVSYELHAFHGHNELSLLKHYGAQIACLASGDGEPGVGCVQPEQLLFFDTETTGLGIGTGNVPFMIGVAYCEAQQLVVEQLFIRNPGEEAAMLHYFHQMLQRFTHIVTYNGRSFDWPLIKNRFVLNRMKADDNAWIQLDLLYSARSLWKDFIPSCRLSDVESGRLGFVRKDDVPGSLAPSLYFEYLAVRDAKVMEGVFRHNEHDVVTLAALAIYLGRALAGEIDLASMSLGELNRLGRWLHKWGKMEAADDAFETMWAIITEMRSPDTTITRAARHDSMLLLADWYKKQRQYERSVTLWQLWLDEKQAAFLPSIDPYIELSMYYEHRQRNYAKALYYAKEASNKLWQRQSFQRKLAIQLEEVSSALTSRIRRLQGKLDAAQQSGKERIQRQPASLNRKTGAVGHGGSNRKRKYQQAAYVMESLI
jgi:uncharacterized protein